MSHTMTRILQPINIRSGVMGTIISLLCSAPFAGAASPLSSSVTQTPTTLVASFTGKTIQPTDIISLTFNPNKIPVDGQFAILNGKKDVTGSFSRVSTTQLDGVFSYLPLPLGRNTLTLYTISPDNTWLAVGHALLVVDAAPQLATQWVPILNLNAWVQTTTSTGLNIGDQIAN